MADLWFLPSASNVNLMKVTLATVNGGSNYDSLNIIEIDRSVLTENQDYAA